MASVNEATPHPAIALLSRCGAGAANANAEEIRRLARDVTDWQRFFELAARHAVVPLADQALAVAAPNIVPAPIAVQLRAASQQGAMISLHLSGELVEAMRALADAGIDAMPFKGPTLAALVYGNLSSRQYQDLDVLVHRADVERTRTALLALGYTPANDYNEDQRDTLMRSSHHEQFLRGATTLELHWSLNNRTLTHDTFERRWWENRQSVTIGGATMQTLGAERLLLYLCMHGGKHSWARLGWLFDLQFALRVYPEADWDLIWRLARDNGAERMVSIGLTLIERLLGDRDLVAPASKGRNDDAPSVEVSTLIIGRLSDGEQFDPSLDFQLQLRSRERLQDRVRYTWHILAAPHPADVALLGLPRSLHRAYYVLRPIRLIWKNLARRVHGARAA